MSKGGEPVVLKEQTADEPMTGTPGVGPGRSPWSLPASPRSLWRRSFTTWRASPKISRTLANGRQSLAMQLTQAELGEIFSKLKTADWTRAVVERVLEVYQIYKRQLAQEKLLEAPYTSGCRGVPGWDS